MNKKEENKIPFKWGAFILACVVLEVVLLLPANADLSVAGQKALAILAFAVILWMTEAVSYPVSAILIISLITILLGFGPSLENPDQVMTTKAALKVALSGFSNAAVALVAGALFLAVAMKVTQLDRRIALMILSRVGSSTKGILIGAIIVGIALGLFIPSPTARVGAIIPIILGMMSVFNIEKDSRFSAMLMIASTQIATIWSIGVKTASAQNLVALSFIEKSYGVTITWGKWFLAAAPWAAIMSVVLFFVLQIFIKPEIKTIPNGKQKVQTQLKKLGPITGSQFRLLIIALGLLFLWATEDTFHSLDSTTIILLGVAIMLFPVIGVMSWGQVEKEIPWGTIVLFATGISLGSVLLKTHAASWLANTFFVKLGLENMSLLLMVGILTGFTIIIHLGFASATSLSSTLIPIVIALVQEMHFANGMGIVLITQFAIGFGFILPVNAPQNMLAYGTDTFSQKDLVKTGITLTIIGYLLFLLFTATYWKWIGLL